MGARNERRNKPTLAGRLRMQSKRTAGTVERQKRGKRVRRKGRGVPTGQQSNWQLLALSPTLSNWLSSAACTGHIGTQCDESGAGTGTRAQAVRLSRQLKRQLNKLCVCVLGLFLCYFFYYICQRRANFEPVINKAELALAVHTKRGVTFVCVCVLVRECA